MQRWLTHWFFHLGAGFVPQTAVPALDPRAPSSLASRGIAAHAAPRRGRVRRAVIVTTRPAPAVPNRLADSLDADPAGVVRLRIDPSDASRTRICGRMADVCDALDALIAREAARDATRTVPMVSGGT